jgi:hypothetical protein
MVMTKITKDILSTIKRLGPKVRTVDIQINVSGTKYDIFRIVHVLNSDLKLIQADGIEPGGRNLWTITTKGEEALAKEEVTK